LFAATRKNFRFGGQCRNTIGIDCRLPKQNGVARPRKISESLPDSENHRPISDRAVDLLKQYFLSHGLLIADGLIAATALVHNEAFVSKNQRDFRFIAGLNLLPYPLKK
jgi:predicted nucleic acid-binding protein